MVVGRRGEVVGVASGRGNRKNTKDDLRFWQLSFLD